MDLTVPPQRTISHTAYHFSGLLQNTKTSSLVTSDTVRSTSQRKPGYSLPHHISRCCTCICWWCTVRCALHTAGLCHSQPLRKPISYGDTIVIYCRYVYLHLVPPLNTQCHPEMAATSACAPRCRMIYILDSCYLAQQLLPLFPPLPLLPASYGLSCRRGGKGCWWVHGFLGRRGGRLGTRAAAVAVCSQTTSRQTVGVDTATDITGHDIRVIVDIRAYSQRCAGLRYIHFSCVRRTTYVCTSPQGDVLRSADLCVLCDSG